MQKILTLTIEKIAGLGDGAAIHEGRRIFVPYTLAGDVVSARISRSTKDADYAELMEVITPGPGRAQPVCRHFATCGGCSLQQLDRSLYTDFKSRMAREAVRKAGFNPALTGPLAVMPVNSRRRAEFKIEGGKLGYLAEGSHRLIDIEECKVLEPDLEALVLKLKPELVKPAGLTGMHINTVDGGYDVLLHGTGPAPVLEADLLLRISIGSEDGIRTLSKHAPVTVTFGTVKVELMPGAFLQAAKEAQALMTGFVKDAVKGAKTILDLFAGLGTFSFPLAEKANVTAIEGEAPMVRAMQEAAQRHAFKNFRAEARNLFTNPVKAAALDRYDAVIMNPPRAGAKEQSAELTTSKVKKLVMISCNPATFARDARLLKEGGWGLVRALPIDQFSFTPHLEILAEFAR